MGRPVKNEYDPDLPEDSETLDVDIAVMLKQQGKVFRIENRHTAIRIAGAPTNLFCTIRLMPGSSVRRLFARG